MIYDDARPAVFLCGPITNAIKSGAFDPAIRQQIKSLIERIESAGHMVYSAHREGHFGDLIPNQPGDVFHRDWAWALLSRAIVAVLPANEHGHLTRTDGTFIELGWALALRKPLFIITDNKATERSYLFEGLLDITPNTYKFEFHEAMHGQEFLLKLRSVLSRVEQPDGQTKTVAFCCTSFGFGPVSKITAVAEALRVIRPRYRFVFVGSNIAEQFARSSGIFDDIVSFDMDAAPTEGALRSAKYDALVNALNFDVLSAWRAQMPPQFFIDSLAWLWPSFPEGIEIAQIYFLQDYLLQARTTEATLPPNTLLVPPIISPSINASREAWEVEKGYLLVNLAGCRNPILPPSQYERYVKVMLQGLFAALQEVCGRGLRNISRVLVCGNKDLLAAGAGFAWGQLPFPVEVQFLPPKRFLVELRRCELLLTSPGLTATLEALALDVPFRFLIPQNFSQFRISTYYRSLGLEQLLWQATFNTGKLFEPTLTEEDGVKEVGRLLDNYLDRGVPEITKGFLNLIQTGEPGSEVERLRSNILAWDGSSRVAQHVVRVIEDFEIETGGVV